MAIMKLCQSLKDGISLKSVFRYNWAIEKILSTKFKKWSQAKTKKWDALGQN